MLNFGNLRKNAGNLGIIDKADTEITIFLQKIVKPIRKLVANSSANHGKSSVLQLKDAPHLLEFIESWRRTEVSPSVV